MKKTALLALLAMLFGASVAWTLAPQETATATETEQDEDAARFEKKVRDCIDLSGGKEQAKAAFDMMITQFSSMPGMDPRFIEKFKNSVSGDDLAELNVPIWMRHLDETDVDGMIAFYKSPVGQKFVKVQPVMQQEAMVAGQKWGQETAIRVLGELDN